MTRNDFQLIADVLAQAERVTEDLSTPDEPFKPGVEFYTAAFAQKLQEAHPRFDAAKFEKAAMPIAAEQKKNAILARLNASREVVLDESGWPVYKDTGEALSNDKPEDALAFAAFEARPQADESDLSLRPRPGETAEDTVNRVTAAARAQIDEQEEILRSTVGRVETTVAEDTAAVLFKDEYSDGEGVACGPIWLRTIDGNQHRFSKPGDTVGGAGAEWFTYTYAKQLADTLAVPLEEV